jgi:LCP family protein required for cell wall assembly
MTNRQARIAVAIFACAATCMLLGIAAARHMIRPEATAAAIAQQIIPSPERVFGKSRLHVLVVGLDYDYDRLDQETSAHARSDVIMALTLDSPQRRIDELSIPRDMVATMPDGRLAKINEAQSEGGVKESEAVVAAWLGAPQFDRYVVLRIDTMKDLVNALGGVTITVKNSDALRGTGPNGPLDYDDSWGHLHVHLKPGRQLLDGDGAVGYARFRHDWCSDPCRILRQQDVIHALQARVSENQTNTLLHAQPLVEALRKDVQTDLSVAEELSLASAFAGIPSKNIITAQVPYSGSIDLPGYGDSIVADETKKRALVASMLDDPAVSARK